MKASCQFLNSGNSDSDTINNTYFYPVENIRPDPQVLIDVVTTKMPFGKYKDWLISDIPVNYLEWMHGKGFPPGKLGMLLSTVFEIKTNGLADILERVRLSVAKKNKTG